MSMNVFIRADRTVSFEKKGGVPATDVQTVKFNAVQTPTAVTYSILNSADPIQAYREYVLSIGEVEREAVYAPDDIWEEGDPIEYREYNWSVEHVNRFDQWLADVDEQGYTVKIEMI